MIKYNKFMSEGVEPFQLSSEYGTSNVQQAINNKINKSPIVKYSMDSNLKMSPIVKWKSTKLDADRKIYFTKNQYYTFIVIQGRKTHSEGTRLDRDDWELKIRTVDGVMVRVPAFRSFSKSSNDLFSNANDYLRSNLQKDIQL